MRLLAVERTVWFEPRCLSKNVSHCSFVLCPPLLLPIIAWLLQRKADIWHLLEKNWVVAIPSGAWKCIFRISFPGTVHLGWGTGLWGDGEKNFGLIKNKILSQLSRDSLDDWNFRSTGSGGRGGGGVVAKDKGSDSLWSENLPCFHLINRLKLQLPPLSTVALFPVQTKASLHQSLLHFSAEASEKAGFPLEQWSLTSS